MNIKKIKIKIDNSIKAIRYRYKKRKLKNEDFTIISNNCWGGFIYRYFKIKYNSPFVGLYIFAPDYISLLENFEEVITKSIRFINYEDSKYKNELLKNQTNVKYPIGLLGDKIEIHFLHYKSQEHAKEKWESRVKRINMDKLLVKFSDRDLCTDEHIKKFNNLKFKNKICFTAKYYENNNSVITFKEFLGKECVQNEWDYHDKYIDVVEILNLL